MKSCFSVTSFVRLVVSALLCLFMRSALAQTPVSITVLPNTVTAGASATGIIALSAPVKRGALTVAITCNTGGVTVPAYVTVGTGGQSATFTVSTQASDRTGIVTLTASEGGGTAVGFFMVQAPPPATVPTNYAAGFWVATPTLIPSYRTNALVGSTMKTYSDGRFCLGYTLFYGPYVNSSGLATAYEDYSTYLSSGRVNANGQINLEVVPIYTLAAPPNPLFPNYGFGNSANMPFTPNYLYDASTLTFSADGKTATLTVIGQPYTWTLSPPPAFTPTARVVLGTYTFTRVQ